jgi:hypothetical protein
VIADHEYCETLAARLLEHARGDPRRGYVHVGPDYSDAACMYWEDRSKPPRIHCRTDVVLRLSAEEFDAVCAHEWRHLIGWWGVQERWALRDSQRRIRWIHVLAWPVFALVRCVFEFQSDAFACSFAGIDALGSALQKIDAWARDQRLSVTTRLRLHLSQPHPPRSVRLAVGRLRGKR